MHCEFHSVTKINGSNGVSDKNLRSHFCSRVLKGKKICFFSRFVSSRTHRKKMIKKKYFGKLIIFFCLSARSLPLSRNEALLALEIFRFIRANDFWIINSTRYLATTVVYRESCHIRLATLYESMCWCTRAYRWILEASNIASSCAWTLSRY